MSKIILSQFLKSVSSEIVFCIGANHGSAYVFFGDKRHLYDCLNDSNASEDLSDLMAREVCDAYYKLSGELAILIEGTEKGKYWLASEYQKTLKK